MKTQYIKTRSNLNTASDYLLVSYWTDDDFHIRSARQELINALCGAPDKDVMIDMLVRDAGINATQAASVIDAILDHSIPNKETTNA